MGLLASYWSSSSYTPAIDALYFHFNSAIVYPSSPASRWGGFTVQRNSSEYPIYLTRGRLVYLVSGSMRNAGTLGIICMSTAFSSSEHAFGLYYDSLNIIISY